MSDLPLRCPDCGSWWNIASFIQGAVLGAVGLFVACLLVSR